MSTMLLPSARLGAQRPRVHSGPRFPTSAGAEAVELAAELGLFLDPWQQFVLEQSLGEKLDGRWAAFQVCLLCPRQNGKGSILEARELAGLFLFDEKRITHSAHEAKTAKDHFERMESLLRNAGYGDDQVVYRRSTTEVSITLRRTGCKLQFYTRTDNGGRGLGGDVVVLDEAFALTRDQMAALMPTMAARSLTGNPQMWFTSSAGFADSDVLAEKKIQGEKGHDRLAYFDWSAAPGLDLTDRESWAQANPGLGFRISEEFIADELPDLGSERFARERLGLWAEVAVSQAINPGVWAQLADVDAERGSSPTFGVTVAPDRSWSAVAAAWRRPDGLLQVCLTEGGYRPGATWLLEHVTALRLRAPGAQVLVDEAARGVLQRVKEVSVAEQAQAENAFADLVLAGGVRHGDNRAVNVSVASSRWKASGNTQVLDRKGLKDISPLRAEALAAWGGARVKAPYVPVLPVTAEMQPHELETQRF